MFGTTAIPVCVLTFTLGTLSFWKTFPGHHFEQATGPKQRSRCGSLVRRVKPLFLSPGAWQNRRNRRVQLPSVTLPRILPIEKSTNPQMTRTAYVHLGYGFGAEGYRERFRRGLVPDEVPYGIHHAERLGWTLLYSEDHAEGTLTRFVRRALNSVLRFDLIHAWRNRHQMAKADIVWTMEERQGLAVLCLGRIGPTPPVLLQVIWLFDQWKSFGQVRRLLLRRLLRHAARVTVHSANYVTQAQGELDLGVKPLLMPFGISGETFPSRVGSQPAHTPIRVLAMGSDRTRDWTTLLAAFGSDPRFEVVAISPQLTPERVAGYNNLTVPVNPPMNKFVEWYGWADVVVIPMVPNLYSGITVALEATRQGVAVVSSRTGGVPTYLAENEAVYVDPEDPMAMKEAVLGLNDEKRAAVVARAQARFASEDYTTAGMAERYAMLSSQVLRDASPA